MYAHAINEGRLDTARPTTGDRGPRETRLAVAVFVDLVANLQLLDAKANALASCAFDDPVLSQKLPGRLGRSLESSVAMLSGSIVERDRLQTFLAHQATHDPLTGIANRAAAAVGIEEAIRRATRSGSAMAVFKSTRILNWAPLAVCRRMVTRLGDSLPRPGLIELATN